MTIQIRPTDRITDIQATFSKLYPHLKVHFFAKAHGENKGSFSKFMIHDHNTLLSTLNPALQETEITVASDTKTWALEHQFESVCQLHVQLFRQSGALWLETSVSDQLTLAEQEAKGAKSTNVPFIEEEPSDYREQE